MHRAGQAQEGTSSGGVLVTGGAGYVGSATAWALAQAGRRVVVLDDLSTGHREFVRWGPLVEGDIADVELVEHTLRQHGLSAVMHFAAKSLVGESVREPALYDAWNRGKTTTLVNTCAQAGVRAFVFSSSCAVYGVPTTVPIPDDHARRPVNPYGRSKAACEDVLFASGLPVAALRYFNACGGLPEEGIGEHHEPETHLIPLALRAAAGTGQLTVYGTDYDTPDGTCIRDYIHVRDLAEAHLAALRYLEAGGESGAWNLGTGRGVSVRDIIAGVARVTGRMVNHVQGERREGDPPVLVAEPSRASAELGWAARHSNLEQIIRDAWSFEQRGAAGGAEPLLGVG